MHLRELKRLMMIDGFPVKGAAIVAYIQGKDDVRGRFWIGLVELSGAKVFKVRWWDGLSETFTAIEGKTSRYQYYVILAYISFDEFSEYGMLSHKSLDDLRSMSSEPSMLCVRRFNEQEASIKSIKKNYKKIPSAVLSNIGSGKSIRFIYVCGLEDPVVIRGAFTRKKIDDKSIYVNCDDQLELTEDEDSFLMLKKRWILEI